MGGETRVKGGEGERVVEVKSKVKVHQPPKKEGSVRCIRKSQKKKQQKKRGVVQGAGTLPCGGNRTFPKGGEKKGNRGSGHWKR